MRILNPGSAEPATGAAFLVVRLVFGFTLLVNHGWGKLTGGLAHFTRDEPWRFVEGVAALGFPAPVLFAAAAALAETAAALLLVAGLATRPAAALVAVTMVVACISHFTRGEYPELATLYLAAAIALLVGGAGRYSADAAWAGTGPLAREE